MLKTIRISLILLAAIAGVSAAQAPMSADQQAVQAVILRVFDGMKEADSAKVRTAFAPGARFVTIGTPRRSALGRVLFCSSSCFLYSSTSVRRFTRTSKEDRFVTIGTRANPDTITYQTVDGWLSGIAGSKKAWEEKVKNVQIMVNDNIASAWMDYTFHLNGALRHCGVDSMELAKVKGEWKITQLGDTQRRDGC